MHMLFFYMMLIIYPNNKRPKGSLFFGQIINIEPSIHLASKLKALKLELSEDLLVHLILISLPKHFGQ